MNLAELVERHKGLATAVALAVIVLAGVWIFRSTTGAGGRARPKQAYFLDLQTGELFATSAKEIPPFARPDGGQAVRAHVFACGGDCAGGERFTAYLSRYSDQALAEFAKGSRGDTEIVVGGQLIAHPDRPDRWVPATGEVALQIQEQAVNRCRGAAIECHP